ncbi:MAG: hypothetical protein ABIJ26_07510 [Candidatus Margulisiibacteriota bacterium]
MHIEAIKIYPLAIRQARSEESIRKASPEGRAIRVIADMSHPNLSACTVSCISTFSLPRRNAGSIFDALADAGKFHVIDPQVISTATFSSGNQIGKKALGSVSFAESQFFLAEVIPSNIVLGPRACDCCFDTRYLDYLTSIAFLNQDRTDLIIRILPYDLRLVRATFFRDPFFPWMHQAGFRESWFVSTRNLDIDDYPSGELLFEALNGLEESISLLQPEYPVLSMTFYLRLQRIAPTSADTYSRILTSALQWEREHLSRRKQFPMLAELHLNIFAARIPELVEQIAG